MRNRSLVLEIGVCAVAIALLLGIDDLWTREPETPGRAPAAVPCVWNRASALRHELKLGTAVLRCLTYAGERERTFTFAPGTSDAHRELFLLSVARLRPEARRLVDLIDGLVEVRMDWDHREATGRTSPRRGGRFAIRVATSRLLARFGVPELHHIIAHELAHVVHLVVLDEAVKARLDAQIPGGCRRNGGPKGCERREERFADTFAKWATGDWYRRTGYSVARPRVPEVVWAAPLVVLADQVGPPP